MELYETKEIEDITHRYYNLYRKNYLQGYETDIFVPLSSAQKDILLKIKRVFERGCWPSSDVSYCGGSSVLGSSLSLIVNLQLRDVFPYSFTVPLFIDFSSENSPLSKIKEFLDQVKKDLSNTPGIIDKGEIFKALDSWYESLNPPYLARLFFEYYLEEKENARKDKRIKAWKNRMKRIEDLRNELSKRYLRFTKDSPSSFLKHIHDKVHKEKPLLDL